MCCVLPNTHICMCVSVKHCCFHLLVKAGQWQRVPDTGWQGVPGTCGGHWERSVVKRRSASRLISECWQAHRSQSMTSVRFSGETDCLCEVRRCHTMHAVTVWSHALKLSRGRSVGASVCPVHCGKTADRIRMPLGIIGRTGPEMRHLVGLRIGPLEGVLLGANLGPAIVTNGDLLLQRRGPLPKLLWADLLVKWRGRKWRRDMDRVNKEQRIVFCSLYDTCLKQ